jgi:hypothetical protein
LQHNPPAKDNARQPPQFDSHNARNASTGASVNGTVTLNGYQTFQTGQSFTFTTAVRTCDPELKPPCRYERVFNDFTVTAPGYNPITFVR